MPESIIGDEIWLQMTEIERIEVVRQGRATLKQLTQGLLDGPENLRTTCRDFLAHTGTGFEHLPIKTSLPTNKVHHAVEESANHSHSAKSRAGLPKGFTFRGNRAGRTRLLEGNIYRLPDGREFVPRDPAGALGGGHKYVLLTLEQHREGNNGSLYIRNDGRICDYNDPAATESELCDIGFRLEDLERTGRYVETIKEGATKTKASKSALRIDEDLV